MKQTISESNWEDDLLKLELEDNCGMNFIDLNTLLGLGNYCLIRDFIRQEKQKSFEEGKELGIKETKKKLGIISGKGFTTVKLNYKVY